MRCLVKDRHTLLLLLELSGKVRHKLLLVTVAAERPLHDTAMPLRKRSNRSSLSQAGAPAGEGRGIAVYSRVGGTRSPVSGRYRTIPSLHVVTYLLATLYIYRP